MNIDDLNKEEREKLIKAIINDVKAKIEVEKLINEVLNKT